jgi:type IV secretion system protein VirB5
MKKLLATLVAAWALLAAPASHAQIPVTDAASLTQQIQQVAAWAQQYQQMVQQYQRMTEQLNAIKGPRGMGQLLNLPGVRQQLPEGFLGEFDRLRSLGIGGASSDSLAIYNSIRTFDCSAQYPKDQPARLACEASAMVNPTNLALIGRSISASQSRMTQLQGLMSAIDGAEDTKAAQDLANRISLETALLHNEKMMMDMALAQQERQAKLIEQQTMEASMKQLKQGGYRPFTPKQ